MGKDKNIREKVFYIKGIHCSTCEILIEKKLLQKKGVGSVDVSSKDNSLRLYLREGISISVNELNKEFSEEGYAFSENIFLEKEEPLFKLEPGKLIINDEKLFFSLKAFFVAFLFLILFFTIEKLQLGRFVSVDNSSSWGAFFLLGLIAGISSCAALIGGVLLSLVKHWNELYLENSSQRKMPHYLFHSGRLFSFFFFGGLLGILGDIVSLDNSTVYASLVMAISFVMVLLALQMLGIKFATKVRLSLPKFITVKAADEKFFKGKMMPFFTGIMTFFLPCGFTLIAQGVSLASGDFFAGGMIMLFFALGTMPTLLAISTAGLTFTKKPHLASKFSAIAGMIILFFAFYNINGQLNVLGFKSLNDFSFKRDTPIEESAGESIVNGKQLIRFSGEEFRYIPLNGNVFQANVQTTIELNNESLLGCANFIAANGLIDNFVALKKGKNLIDVGKPSPGKYKLTCSMGMVSPVTLTFK